MQDHLTEPKRSDVRTTLIGAALAASLTAAGYFLIAWTEEKSVNERERLQLIEMTNSFVSVFSQNRGDGAPVPATFRRLGIEHFSNSDQNDSAKQNSSVRMPGRPGLELGISEPDPRLGTIIEDFVAKPTAPPVHEYRFEGNRLIGRTVLPSIANNDSCVTCHNDILQADTYVIGDVMGAYIVERDLTANLIDDIKYSGIWFLSSFLLLWLLASRERNHNTNILRL